MSTAFQAAASKQPLQQHFQIATRSFRPEDLPRERFLQTMANSFSSDEGGSVLMLGRNVAKPLAAGMVDAGKDGSPVNGSHGSLKFNRVGGGLQGFEAAEAAGQADPKVDNGFTRPDMYKAALVGSVAFYERHVFLCYKEAQSWPPQVEAADFDRLPRHLVAALRARRNDMPKKTRLTICEGRDGTDSCNGDVFIFPDMLKYRSLTHFDVDTFVEEVLVRGKEWNPGKPEHLTGSHIFVCAHANRDARCGHCGPILIERFKEEIAKCGLKGKVFVRACSHVSGHKYAGNVIVYSSQAKDGVTGHWYGYVTPNDVNDLLHLHIGKGQIVERLWRGQLGLKEEEQKQAQQIRLQFRLSNGCQEEQTEGCVCGAKQDKCCSDGSHKMSPQIDYVNSETQSEFGVHPELIRHNISNSVEENRLSARQPNQVSRIQSCWHKVTNFFETWEREDTFVSLVVIGAAVSAGLAYRLYKMTI
ncbi:hypothetical protein O6H91_06G114600 [Diphasiastrum complanatum]|uniref:Uncharacterized protein n=2 Tax=Diphasiastrum complanatum TaxID=34168 RepID=A0ACC2DHT1_DIPCM|nr:hypothetical protein O6H91_06G114100 [Diphasiastrum complanatum]KAJ7553827.1 hypothetical protein O6H91_06G114600 [Diphasiastrum complanatum]